MDYLGKLISKGFYEFYQYRFVPKILTGMLLLFNLLIAIVSLMTNEMEPLKISLVLSTIATLAFFAIYGLIEYIIQLPFRLKIEKYKKLFENMNFKSVNDEYPFLISDDENEYVKVLAFRSLIPLNEWIKKQNLIETFLNEKISKIINDKNNNNLVYIYITKKELPSDLLWNSKDHWINNNNTMNLGISYQDYITMNLNNNAHAFIAGETGSGKTNLMKTMIYQSIIKGYEVKLIDFKRGVSFSIFDNYITTYSDHESVVKVLNDLVEITNFRFDLFRDNRVEDINEYNRLRQVTKIKRIVVYIDELAELIKSGDKEATKIIIGNLETLTRLSRAAGINLIMGIQRPDATIINGQIKNNVSFRVCGRFVDPEPSRIMLGNDMAMTLPKTRGRFIVKDDEYIEFQAFKFDSSFFENSREQAEPLIESKAEPTPQPTPPPPTPAPIEPPTQPKEIEFNFDDISI